MQCHEQPGNRPCSACGLAMSTNALYRFVGRRVQCLCEPCWLMGWRFDDAGAVVLGPEPRARAVEATS